MGHFGGTFQTVYQTHITAVRRDSPEFIAAVSAGWTPLDKLSNRVMWFELQEAPLMPAESNNTLSANSRTMVSTKVEIAGREYPQAVMLSFLGGLDFSDAHESSPNVSVTDGLKYAYVKGQAMCPEQGCTATFSSSYLLKAHFQSAHLGLKLHACPQCEKCFAQKSYVSQHVAAVYENKRSHLCTLCHKTFQHRGTLNSHI